jgi:hypothetical protein
MDLAASVIQKAWRYRTSTRTDMYTENLAASKIQNAWKAFADHTCGWCNVPITYKTSRYYQGLCGNCEEERREMADEHYRETFGECDKCGEILYECHCGCTDDCCDCHE